jgi:hypothetical protein
VLRVVVIYCSAVFLKCRSIKVNQGWLMKRDLVADVFGWRFGMSARGLAHSTTLRGHVR